MNRIVVDFISELETRKATVRAGVVAGCPVREVIHGLSGKWVWLFMIALSERRHRFGELRRLFPDISQRMLTQTLRSLQRDGYVRRDVLPTSPPTVEYSLTSLGESLCKQLRPLFRWAELNSQAVREARTAFDNVRTTTPRDVVTSKRRD